MFDSQVPAVSRHSGVDVSTPREPRGGWAPHRGALSSLVLLLLAVPLLAGPAEALRIVDYNILNYPGNSGTARAPHYRTVLGPVEPDIIVAQEISSAIGPNQFLNEVLNVLEPGEWATVPFIDGNDTDGTFFYKPARVEFLGQSAFYPNPVNPVRLVHVYRIRPVGYTSPDTHLWIYTAHLKASTGYESQRLAECAGIRDSLNAMPAGTRAMLAGDLNFYRQSSEPGYARLLESQANNTGRLYDLLPAGEWHDNGVFAQYHTQSPCLSGTCASGAATGGMDDRFDFILPTWNLVTPHGLAVIPNTYISVGNDGQHLNKNITDAPIIPEGADYATSLKLASDHLPLRIDLQLPAEIDVAGALAFDPVIVGATPPVRELTIGNPAIPPADSLNCQFEAPAGFLAPSPLAVAAGFEGIACVALETDAPASLEGPLVVASDAPDEPLRLVSLSATVLGHAEASLDSLALVLEDTLDFGTWPAGEFPPRVADLHNRGWQALQARLAVQAATIDGGGERFSLASFAPVLLAGTGARWTVLFDGEEAPADSTFAAVLTFLSADEPLPGAGAQPPVRYVLRAHIGGDGSGTPGPAPVWATRLWSPAPNPLTAQSALRFDLEAATNARLEVFDPAGRRVALLADGPRAAGTHIVRWEGRDEDGRRVGPGVYFVRLSLPGLAPRAERLVIVR